MLTTTPLLFPQLPLDYGIVAYVVAVAITAYAFWGVAPVAAPWRKWAPHLTGSIAILLLIVWIEGRPGPTAFVGWVITVALAFLMAALLISAAVAFLPSAMQGTAPAGVMRTAFDETQSINILPSSLGGKHLLRLRNLATLRLGAPYSLEMVTLRQDATPTRLPDIENESITVEDLTITKGSATEYTYDIIKNKRHEIAVAGRAYIVTLLEARKLNTPHIANPIEYVFGITEK